MDWSRHFTALMLRFARRLAAGDAIPLDQALLKGTPLYPDFDLVSEQGGWCASPVVEAFTPFSRWKPISRSSSSRAGSPSRMGRTLVYTLSHTILPDPALGTTFDPEQPRWQEFLAGYHKESVELLLDDDCLYPPNPAG